MRTASQFKWTWLRSSVLLALSLTCSVCLATPLFHAYTLLGEHGRSSIRVLTDADTCPMVKVDGRRLLAMTLRAPKEEVPARSAAQAEIKPALFPVLSCELQLPVGVKRASVGGQSLPLLQRPPRRILILGDSGCRMKGSDHAFQACNDAAAWPFARIAAAAVRFKPDLVLHVGDYHYRESPCPPGDAGCAGSPWGNGYDAWAAEFFVPAQALLRAAPWVVARGDHEICTRAGQGWFRFLDPRPYRAATSCNDAALDGEADYSEPYAVDLGRDTQLIVFDSARITSKVYAAEAEPGRIYQAQLRQVDVLAGQRLHSFFVSHHPVLAFSSAQGRVEARPGNAALQALMGSLHPQRLLAPGVDLAIHGHVHLFQSLSFASDHPATLVNGNSGSSLYSPLPARLPEGVSPAPGAQVAEFFTHDDFGFLIMERHGRTWRLTERDIRGRVLHSCRLRQDKLHCRNPGRGAVAGSP